ncbi:MAG TPA: 2OG-Fe(II) oxygenase [Rhizomicrobium sp.]|nr:2OG-Fe(II) oxygenase [Rhizomicrobium sp.]
MSQIKSSPIPVGGPLIVWPDAFTPKELDVIIALGDRLAPMKAEVIARKDDTDHLRITRVAWMERNDETAWLYAKLEEIVLRLNTEFFKYDLFGLVEAFQYTVYDDTEGGHYNWHVDLGTQNTEPRKISLSLQLTDPADYEGCRLVLEAGDGPYIADASRGTVIAFPSYVLHRVTPIESGVRKSLVIWVAGPEFR